MELNDLKKIFWVKIVPEIVVHAFVGSVVMSLAYELVGDVKRQFTWVLGCVILLATSWRAYNAIRGYRLINKMSKELDNNN